MSKKKFKPCEVEVILFTNSDVLTTSVFGAIDYDDDAWKGFENWGS